MATTDPEKAIATRQLARCSLAAGNIPEATRLYKSALKLDYSVPHVWQVFLYLNFKNGIL
jgi:hypothetical protein